MTRDEWKLVFSKASENITNDTLKLLKLGIQPSQGQLIAKEIINQIFKAL